MSVRRVGCGSSSSGGISTIGNIILSPIVQPVLINPDEHAGSEAPPIMAESALSALRVVTSSPTTGKLTYADPNNAAHAFRLLGLLQTAVAADAETQALIRGVVTDSSWSWQLDKPIWLGANGTLTQAPTGTAFLVIVASVINAITLNFELQEVMLYG